MYLIDFNILVTANRSYYAPDLAPYYWEWLIDQAQAGSIASISQVRDELKAGDPKDFLHAWSTRLPDEFWQEPLVEAASSYQAIYDWASHPDRPYNAAAINEFFSVADSSLIAQAHAHELEIATFEKPRPNAKRKIFIPDACEALGVRYCDGFAMYRHLGLTFR